MNFLQYTSKEMFSSTDLIRKSKSIFDKLNKNEIEKAIILRDGKPSFLLLDFDTYEELMIDYMKLKENAQSNKVVKEEKIEEDIQETTPEEVVTLSEDTQTSQENEIADEDVQKALEEIEKLSFSDTQEEKKKEQPLKDFWE